MDDVGFIDTYGRVRKVEENMNKKLMKIYHEFPGVIQNLGINIYELNEWRTRRSAKFRDNLSFLRKTEKWGNKDFLEYQNKHLKNIVAYAYKYVPYYHELYKKNNIDITKIQTIDDLEKLPMVQKEDIIKYKNFIRSVKSEPFITRHTSGTTGEPLEIRISSNLDILQKCNAYRRDIWAGYKDDWIGRFVGDTPIKNCRDKNLFRKSYILKRIIFPSYCLSLKTMPSIIHTLERQNIKFLQSYPSTAYLLAKFLERTDNYLPMKAILYSSEPMYEFQRELIEKRFKTRVFGFYGQMEGVVSALECEEGEYHTSMIDGILEITNKDKERVPEGKKGFTISTSLHNYAMPLIRYALNDYTGYKDKNCDCGRKLPLLYPVETKKNDFIITPLGKIISPSLVTRTLKHAISGQHIIESQIVQKTFDSIIIKIVPTENYSDFDDKLLLKSFIELVGDGVSIKIEHVEKIHQSKAYKKRFVINEIGGDYIEKAFENLE